MCVCVRVREREPPNQGSIFAQERGSGRQGRGDRGRERVRVCEREREPVVTFMEIGKQGFVLVYSFLFLPYLPIPSPFLGPPSREYGTYKTVEARFWLWLSGRSLDTLLVALSALGSGRTRSVSSRG